MSLAGKSLISISDYTKSDWLNILKKAKQFEKKQPGNILAGKVVASLFFEPSTRTRLSFESAVQKLGGSVIGFDQAGSSSTSKGESLKDTIRTVSNYADLIVIRHPLEGSARLASEYATVPVVNAGDGSNQHPTQTLLDLYSIQKTQRSLNNLTITFVGDLKYGRTMHSTLQAMSQFKSSFLLVSAPELVIPESLRRELEESTSSYKELADLGAALPQSDIVYMTRIQKERFADPIEYEQVKNRYVLRANMVSGTKPNLKVLHPLPRNNEIDEDVDQDKKAYYFEQALNGVYTRQAIVASILGVNP